MLVFVVVVNVFQVSSNLSKTYHPSKKEYPEYDVSGNKASVLKLWGVLRTHSLPLLLSLL